jgi:hypothetical protein
MLKLVPGTTADGKPDFTIGEPLKPGQVITLMMSQNRNFKSKWLVAYSVEVPASGAESKFSAPRLDRGTWFARYRINAGPWRSVITVPIP